MKYKPDSKNKTAWESIPSQTHLYLREHAVSSVVLAVSVDRGSITMGDFCLLFFFIIFLSERVLFQFTSSYFILMFASGLIFLAAIQVYNLHCFVVHIQCCTTEPATQGFNTGLAMTYHNKLMISMCKEILVIIQKGLKQHFRNIYIFLKD